MNRSTWSCVLMFFLCLPFMTGMTGVSYAQDNIMSDDSITGAVERALRRDGVVPVDTIRVQTKEGIVNLTGSVSNILARDRSVYIAELVKGVRAVNSRLNVRPSEMRTDEQIARAIQDALQADPVVPADSVQASSTNGTVTLNGAVRSFAIKQIAENVAKGVRGVLDVKNYMSVMYQPERTDNQIHGEIEHRLRWDALVNDGQIHVAVKAGRVDLSGSVGSAAEKRQARWDAWVKGVREVDDSALEVKWYLKNDDLRSKYVLRSNEEIQKAIEDAVAFDPRIASGKITPTVEDGIVTLRGTVSNLAARKAVEAIAKSTVGVTGVNNSIEIQLREPIADSDIEDAIRSGINENPYTSQSNIAVSVYDGMVDLGGRVASTFQKAEAGRIVSRAQGVRSVDNELQVIDVERSPEASLHFDWYTPMISPPDRPLDDQELHDRIKDQLWWSPFVNDEHVIVKVFNGTVTLSGTVDTWRAYQAAQESARGSGAKKVINRLRVKEYG